MAASGSRENPATGHFYYVESYENTVVFKYNARVEIDTGAGWQSIMLALKHDRSSKSSELVTFT